MKWIDPTTGLCRLRPWHVAAVLLVLLVGIELFGRAFGYFQIMEFLNAPAYGYRMRPSQTVCSYGIPIQINEAGLRGPEIVTPKPAATVRIAFVGDSVCYSGGHVPEETLFMRQIERTLQSEGLPVEVVNISAPGWAPKNWAGYVGTNGYHEADIVVYELLDSFWARPLSTLRKHGFMQNAPALRVHALFWKVRAILRPPGINPIYDPYEEMDTNLDAMKFLFARAAGKERLCLRIPLSEGSVFTADHDPDAYAALLRGETVLDLRGEPHGATWFMDALHLSASGHKTVAEKTLPTVRQLVKQVLAKRGGTRHNTEPAATPRKTGDK